MKSKIILSFFLAFVIIAITFFVSQKAILRYYSDLDKARENILMTASNNDKNIFLENAKKLKSVAMFNEMQNRLDILTNQKHNSSKSFRQNLINDITRRLFNQEAISDMEILSLVQNMYSPKAELIKIKDGELLLEAALSAKRFLEGEKIAKAFDLDSDKYYLKTILLGAKKQDFTGKSKEYENEFNLLSRSKNPSQNYEKELNARLGVYGNNDYFWHRYILAQCYYNIGQKQKAFEIFENMHDVVTSPPLRNFSHRENIRNLAAKFCAANGLEDKYLQVLKTTVNTTEHNKVLAGSIDLFARAKGIEPACDLLDKIDSFEYRLKEAFRIPTRKLWIR